VCLTIQNRQNGTGTYITDILVALKSGIVPVRRFKGIALKREQSVRMS